MSQDTTTAEELREELDDENIPDWQPEENAGTPWCPMYPTITDRRPAEEYPPVTPAKDYDLMADDEAEWVKRAFMSMSHWRNMFGEVDKGRRSDNVKYYIDFVPATEVE